MALVLSDHYRSALCDLFEQLGPQAPTLCEGWTAQDLAAHLFLRENDPLSMPGMFVPALEPITAARTRTLLVRQGFEQIVSTLRHGPVGPSVLRLGALERRANGLEHLVHHEDLLRAQPVSSVERPALRPEERFALADQVWGALGAIGRMIGRRCGTGLRIVRDDGAAEARTLAAGEPRVVVRGDPTELAMWLYGRPADVEKIGEPGPLSLVDKAVSQGI